MCSMFFINNSAKVIKIFHITQRVEQMNRVPYNALETSHFRSYTRWESVDYSAIINSTNLIIVLIFITNIIVIHNKTVYIIIHG